MRTTDTNVDVDIDLPCIDGMLVGTLALMTGYAEHQCEQGNAHRRNLIAQKVVSNLLFLASYPCIPPPMALAMRNLQNHWHTLTALGALEEKAGRNASSVPRAAVVRSAVPAALRVAQPTIVQ